MNKRLFYLFSALLILAFSVGLTGASTLKPLPNPGQRSRPVKLFTGNFVNPAGQVHRIEIVDGGNINVKNAEEGLFYRISAKSAPDGTVDLTIQKYLDAEYSSVLNEERVNVSLDGRTKRSSLAAFGINLNGVKRARAELRSGPSPALNKAVGGACCIDCGDGWEVCCGVAIFDPGWIACCSIDTSCASCAVCAWWLD